MSKPVKTDDFFSAMNRAEEGIKELNRKLSETQFSSGELKMVAYSGTPTGWIVADGSVKLRADYPNLFAAIGTTYNTGGETGTQFRLPPLSTGASYKWLIKV